MRNNLGGNYILTVNLDENSEGYDTYASSSANEGKGWLPIGTSGSKFTGRLEGNGYTISDLYINRDTIYGGLFGFLSTTAEIVDVLLLDVEMTVYQS